VIDPKLLRSDPDAVARNLARRGFVLDVDALRALEEKRKPCAVKVDQLRAERNAQAKAVGQAKARGEDPRALMARGEALTAELARAETELEGVQSQLEEWQLGLPNLLHESVPTRRARAGASRADSTSPRATTWKSASGSVGSTSKPRRGSPGRASW